MQSSFFLKLVGEKRWLSASKRSPGTASGHRQRCQKAADVFARAVGCGCHPGKLLGPKDDHLMMFNDINDDINDDFYRWLMPKLVQ